MRVLLTSNGGDINLLVRASTAIGEHHDALPSWVPDWRKPIMINDADYSHSPFNNLEHAAGGLTSTSIDFDEGGKLLITKGVRLDVLVNEVEPHKWRGQRLTIVRTLTGVAGFTDTYATPHSPSKGDEVWVLYGAKWPMLLRKREAGYMFLRIVMIFEVDGEDVKSGDWMNNAVDLEKDTQVLRII